MDVDELISRGALIDQLERLATHENDWRQSCILGIVHTINNAPAVDPESLRPKGRWVKTNPSWKPRCSACGEYHLHSWADCVKCNYCPNCGAKMEG